MRLGASCSHAPKPRLSDNSADRPKQCIPTSCNRNKKGGAKPALRSFSASDPAQPRLPFLRRLSLAALNLLLHQPSCILPERGRRVVCCLGGGLCLRAPFSPSAWLARSLSLALWLALARSLSLALPFPSLWFVRQVAVCVYTQHQEQENGLIREAGSHYHSHCTSRETATMRRQTEDWGTRQASQLL